MKAILIFPLLIASSLLSNELSWVDEQVNAIKPNRNGVSNRSISKLRNPFVYLKKNKPKNVKGSKKTTKVNSIRTSTTNSTSNSNLNNKLVDSQKVTTPNKTLTLSAIINSSALINGEWYKLGEKIHKYRITRITKTSVTLVKNKKTTILSTKSSASKLKFK